MLSPSLWIAIGRLDAGQDHKARDEEDRLNVSSLAMITILNQTASLIGRLKGSQMETENNNFGSGQNLLELKSIVTG